MEIWVFRWTWVIFSGWNISVCMQKFSEIGHLIFWSNSVCSNFLLQLYNVFRAYATQNRVQWKRFATTYCPSMVGRNKIVEHKLKVYGRKVNLKPLDLCPNLPNYAGSCSSSDQSPRLLSPGNVSMDLHENDFQVLPPVEILTFYSESSSWWVLYLHSKFTGVWWCEETVWCLRLGAVSYAFGKPLFIDQYSRGLWHLRFLHMPWGILSSKKAEQTGIIKKSSLLILSNLT